MKIFFLTIIGTTAVIMILILGKSEDRGFEFSQVFKPVSGINPATELEQTKLEQTETEKIEKPGETFNHPSEDFSFSYPTDFKVTSTVLEDSKEIFTVEKDNDGFQIFILPFDEPGPITPERIKKDIPDLIIKNSQYISVDGTQALTFYSQDQDLGETYEAWFAHKGKLYQVTTYKKLDELVKQILEMWKWK